MTSALPIVDAPRTASGVRDYISYSAINTYRTCPLRYYFRYVEGLPEETVSSNLVFGGAIHAAIEHHFIVLMEGEEKPLIDQLHEVFRDAWKSRQSDMLLSLDGDHASFDQLALRSLQAFLDSPASTPEGTVLGVEEEIRESIIDGCPDILARLDLIVDMGHSVLVTDFKTARSRWNADQIEASSEQLLLYGELVRRMQPDRPVRLQYAVITKTKSPAVDVITVNSSPELVARTLGGIERVWRAIESRHFYPAPSVMNCPSCSYRKACRDWQG